MKGKRVALISPIPEFDLIIKDDILKVHTTVDPFTGSSVTYREPIALEFIDAYLKKGGYQTKLFTETTMKSQQLIQSVIDYKPQLVGISVHSSVVYPDTITIAKMLKERDPKTKIIIGGYHPSGELIEFSRGNIDKTLLHSPDIDYVSFGEGEKTFLELADSITKGESAEGIKGIAYKDETGNIIINPRRERIDFSQSPWATRYEEVLKYSRCAPLAYPAPNDQRAAAQISASRGCAYGCDFCSSMTVWPAKIEKPFGRNCGEPIVQYRDPRDVVAEMKWLENKHGVNFFTFTDLTFNYDGQRAKNLCDTMISEGAAHKPNGKDDIGWFAYSTVDKAVSNPKTIRLMGEAGCTRIGIGLESLHGNILKQHKPNNTLETEKKAIEIVNSEGILNRSYLMVGWPDETPEMFDETRNILLSGELPIDQLRLAFSVPFLGTPVFAKYKDRLLTNDWRKFTGDEPVIRNDYMSPDEMRDRVKDTLTSFYSSEEYQKHIRGKSREFPHLESSYRYWEEYLQKRGIIPTSHKLLSD
ncbi:MAG: radical SAM protein [Candidatus Aenigmatarchaeota archaeon]